MLAWASAIASGLKSSLFCQCWLDKAIYIYHLRSTMMILVQDELIVHESTSLHKHRSQFGLQSTTSAWPEFGRYNVHPQRSLMFGGYTANDARHTLSWMETQRRKLTYIWRQGFAIPSVSLVASLHSPTAISPCICSSLWAVFPGFACTCAKQCVLSVLCCRFAFLKRVGWYAFWPFRVWGLGQVFRARFSGVSGWDVGGALQRFWFRSLSDCLRTRAWGIVFFCASLILSQVFLVGGFSTTSRLNYINGLPWRWLRRFPFIEAAKLLSWSSMSLLLQCGGC